MNHKLILLCVIILFAACSGDRKMDASTDETTKASMSKMRAALPETHRGEFDEAMLTLLSRGGDEEGTAATPAEMTLEVRLSLDGKNADEIIAEASRIREERQRRKRDAMATEIAKLEAKYKAFAHAKAQIDRIKILSSNFYVLKNDMQEKRPVIELRVKNESPFPVYRVYFTFSLSVPSSGFVSPRIAFHHDIDNGLQPGETAHWHLSSHEFSDLGHMKISGKRAVDIALVRVDGPDGNALFATKEFSDEEKMRLDALKQEYESL
ncbi:MAG: DUF6694 family lipoprotein [Smithellaceae bacterium]